MTEPTQLHAFADGELSTKEANDLREVLRSDPRAAAQVDAILNLKDALAKNSLRHDDEEVWKGCLRRLDEIDKTRRVEGFVSRYAWALCGILFVFILSGRFAMRNVQGETSRIADVTRLFGARPATPQDQAQAKMYEQLLKGVSRGLDAHRVDVSPPQTGFVHDIPAARFLMRDVEGDMILTRVDGLLNLPETSPTSTPGIEAGVAGGANCLVWRLGGRTWVLTGSRPLESLHQVASELLGRR